MLGWRRLLPRCRAHPPSTLPDATPCIRWRGHLPADDGWHADGSAYIWHTDGSWQWMGPHPPQATTVHCPLRCGWWIDTGHDDRRPTSPPQRLLREHLLGDHHAQEQTT